MCLPATSLVILLNSLWLLGTSPINQDNKRCIKMFCLVFLQSSVHVVGQTAGVCLGRVGIAVAFAQVP